MKVYRTEVAGDVVRRDEEAHRQRIEHRLDEPQQFSDGPRAQLARELSDFWRTDHRLLTLREEVDASERGPRGQLAYDLRDAHRSDSVVHNRIADAMDAAGLAPRERLAAEVREMWRGGK